MGMELKDKIAVEITITSELCFIEYLYMKLFMTWKIEVMDML